MSAAASPKAAGDDSEPATPVDAHPQFVVRVYSARKYDKWSLSSTAQRMELTGSWNGRIVYQFTEEALNPETAGDCSGVSAVCAFVNDNLGAETLRVLAKNGVKLIAMRCAGYNNVDLAVAKELGMKIARVPAYSPYAVAEHAVALALALNRNLKKALAREREGYFSLDGLLGFDMHGKTVGVVGTGKIGMCFIRIMLGFGCKVVAHDLYPSAEAISLGVVYTDKDSVYAQSDIISLHANLTPESRHMIDAVALSKMKMGVMLINVSRGELIDTDAAIAALKSGRLGALGLDVVEGESSIFFRDSDEGIKDDNIARLMSFPNCIITGHQAFFTREALMNIADSTTSNLTQLLAGEPCPNLVA